MSILSLQDPIRRCANLLRPIETFLGSRKPESDIQSPGTKGINVWKLPNQKRMPDAYAHTCAYACAYAVCVCVCVHTRMRVRMRMCNV